MPKRSDYVRVVRQVQVVRFRFDDGREASFMGPPLPADYGAVTAIEFSPLLQLPDDLVLGVRANGTIGFLNPRVLEDDG